MPDYYIKYNLANTKGMSKAPLLGDAVIVRDRENSIQIIENVKKYITTISNALFC